MPPLRIMTDGDIWRNFFFLGEDSRERQEVERTLERLEPFARYGLIEFAIAEPSFDLLCLGFGSDFAEAVSIFGSMVEVIPVDDRQMESARELLWRDLYSAVECVCAREEGISLLITQHPEHFVETESLPRIRSLGEILALTATCTLADYLTTIAGWIESHKSRTACTLNVHLLMEVHRDPSLTSIFSRINLITPSGMPIVWILKRMDMYRQERVTGTALFENLLDYCYKNRKTVFLLAKQPDLLEGIEEKLRNNFPGFNIFARCLSSTNSTHTDEEIVQEINSTRADLVFVSLPHPEQEIWISERGSTINSVVVGVGRAFPIYIGILQEAPSWLQNAGMEWLFQWFQHPFGLRSEYSSSIPRFLWLALKNQVFQPNRQSYPIALPQSERMLRLLWQINAPEIFV